MSSINLLAREQLNQLLVQDVTVEKLGRSGSRKLTYGEKRAQLDGFKAVIQQKHHPAEEREFSFFTKMAPRWRGMFSVKVGPGNRAALKAMLEEYLETQDSKNAVYVQFMEEEGKELDGEDIMVVFTFNGWTGYFGCQLQKDNAGQFQVYVDHSLKAEGSVKRIPVSVFPHLYTSVQADIRRMNELTDNMTKEVPNDTPFSKAVEASGNRKRKAADRQLEQALVAVGRAFLGEAGLVDTSGGGVKHAKAIIRLLGSVGLLKADMLAKVGVVPGANVSVEIAREAAVAWLSLLQFNADMWGDRTGVDAAVGAFVASTLESGTAVTTLQAYLVAKQEALASGQGDDFGGDLYPGGGDGNADGDDDLNGLFTAEAGGGGCGASSSSGERASAFGAAPPPQVASGGDAHNPPASIRGDHEIAVALQREEVGVSELGLYVLRLWWRESSQAWGGGISHC